MPLTPYLKEAVFTPKDIELLNATFVALCNSLDLLEPDDQRAEMIARKVIDVARTGERDPQKIQELVLRDLEALDRRSA